MARAPLIRLALLAATLAVASACDILRPPARSLSSQLDYLPRTRENLQILARWWPLIAPDPQAAGLPTGQLPIALPVTFPSGISRAADLAGLAVPPAEVTCAVGCRATWLGRFHQTPFSGVAWIAPGGRLLGARFDVTSEAYGTWRTWVGPGAATHTTRLVDLRLQPIAAWEHACAATGGCTFTGEYRTGMRMRGRTDPSGYVATVPLGAWGRAFPWAAYPRSLQAAYDGGWRYAVGFAGGDGVRIAYRAGGWSRDGPAALGGAGDTHADGRRIALRHGFPSDQVLLEWRTEITAATAITTATRFHIREERESRRGVLRTIEVSAERQVDGLLSLRWRDDDSDGLVQFRRDDMGWRVDAYWTTRGGALLRAGGHAYATGLWLGDLEGWRPLDTREPSESAEWTMLPDGTFASLLLFRQEDGSFVDLRTYSPSEGAAPSLFA